MTTASEASNTQRDDHAGRSAARLLAVQALYQMEVSGKGVKGIIEEFVHHRMNEEIDGVKLAPADEGFFSDLVTGVVDRQVDIDRSVNGVLATGWRMERLDSIVRSLLRTATYELLGRGDVPPKVVINEYLDVGHAFFPEDQVAFINGALDTLAKDKRGLGE